MRAFGHPETANGWHFLTGKVDSISRVTDAVGFRYKWDPALATFAHASAIYVLTPEGRLSKYFYGIHYSPTDLRFGLVEASHDRIGTAVDQFLLSAASSIRQPENTHGWWRTCSARREGPHCC
jgi:protein SCO1/2